MCCTCTCIYRMVDTYHYALEIVVKFSCTVLNVYICIILDPVLCSWQNGSGSIWTWMGQGWTRENHNATCAFESDALCAWGHRLFQKELLHPWRESHRLVWVCTLVHVDLCGYYAVGYMYTVHVLDKTSC